MKISDFVFSPGCACCQEHDVAEAQINGASVKVLRVPQENGGVAYTVLVNRAGSDEVRHMKLSELEADAAITSI